jgi:hypothetical protein
MHRGTKLRQGADEHACSLLSPMEHLPDLAAHDEFSRLANDELFILKGGFENLWSWIGISSKLERSKNITTVVSYIYGQPALREVQATVAWRLCVGEDKANKRCLRLPQFDPRLKLL